jgi:hypothetical protein
MHSHKRILIIDLQRTTAEIHTLKTLSSPSVFVFCFVFVGHRRSQWPRGVRCRSAATRLLGSWVRIPPGYGCLSLVSVVCCQVEVSATGRSLVQRIPTECGVSECDRGTSQRTPTPPLALSSHVKKKIVEHEALDKAQKLNSPKCNTRIVTTLQNLTT